MGPTDTGEAYMGPVISEGPERDPRLHRHWEEGSETDHGWRGEGREQFIPPTVFADVSPNARIFQEEIFGPVLVGNKGKGLRRRDPSRQ